MELVFKPRLDLVNGEIACRCINLCMVINDPCYL